MARGQAAADTPLQQYSGPLVAGFTPQQIQAMNTVQGSQGLSQPYINAATQYVGQGAAPVWNQTQQFSPQQVQQYESPYTQDVTQATQRLFNEQNAQQQNQLNGSAAAAGAFGGDRQGVAQAQLAGQQQLAQAPVLANLQQQGYGQSLGEFNTQQALQANTMGSDAWRASNAGSQLGALGGQAENNALQGSSALLQTGALQQQLAQEQLNIPYEQFLQQQAYPFQTTNYLAGIAEGAGGQMGGSSITQGPQPSALGTYAGLGLAGLGGYGLAGGFNGLFSGSNAPTGSIPTQRRGGVVRRASGGGVPDVSFGYVPTTSNRSNSNRGTSFLGGSSTASGGGRSSGGMNLGSLLGMASLGRKFADNGGGAANLPITWNGPRVLPQGPSGSMDMYGSGIDSIPQGPSGAMDMYDTGTPDGQGQQLAGLSSDNIGALDPSQMDALAGGNGTSPFDLYGSSGMDMSGGGDMFGGGGMGMFGGDSAGLGLDALFGGGGDAAAGAGLGLDALAGGAEAAGIGETAAEVAPLILLAKHGGAIRRAAGGPADDTEGELTGPLGSENRIMVRPRVPRIGAAVPQPYRGNGGGSSLPHGAPLPANQGPNARDLVDLAKFGKELGDDNSSDDDGSKSGGRIPPHRRLAYGGVTPGVESVADQTPGAIQQRQRMMAMPIDKLQQLAVAYQPTTPMGVTVRRALGQKLMNPDASAKAAPITAPQGPTAPSQSGAARGGVARRRLALGGMADGGNPNIDYINSLGRDISLPMVNQSLWARANGTADTSGLGGTHGGLGSAFNPLPQVPLDPRNVSTPGGQSGNQTAQNPLPLAGLQQSGSGGGNSNAGNTSSGSGSAAGPASSSSSTGLGLGSSLGAIGSLAGLATGISGLGLATGALGAMGDVAQANTTAQNTGLVGGLGLGAALSGLANSATFGALGTSVADSLAEANGLTSADVAAMAAAAAHADEASDVAAEVAGLAGHSTAGEPGSGMGANGVGLGDAIGSPAASFSGPNSQSGTLSDPGLSPAATKGEAAAPAEGDDPTGAPGDTPSDAPGAAPGDAPGASTDDGGWGGFGGAAAEGAAGDAAGDAAGAAGDSGGTGDGGGGGDSGGGGDGGGGGGGSDKRGGLVRRHYAEGGAPDEPDDGPTTEVPDDSHNYAPVVVPAEGVAPAGGMLDRPAAEALPESAPRREKAPDAYTRPSRPPRPEPKPRAPLYTPPDKNRNLSMGLLAAGLGTIASRSPYAAQAIGEGGLGGLKSYVGLEQSDRQAAFKQAEIERQHDRDDMMRRHYENIDDRPTVDHSGATTKIYWPSSGEWVDTKVPTQAALSRSSTERYQNAQLAQGRYKVETITRPDPENPGQLQYGQTRTDLRHADTAPTIQWFKPGERPQGKLEGRDENLRVMWNSAHPVGEGYNAEQQRVDSVDYVRGRKIMSEDERQRAARNEAIRMAGIAAQSSHPPKDLDAYRQQQYEKFLTDSAPPKKAVPAVTAPAPTAPAAVTPPAPAAPAAAAPAPAALPPVNDTILDQARAAVAAGAPRDAVIERLKRQYQGFDPSKF